MVHESSARQPCHWPPPGPQTGWWSYPGSCARAAPAASAATAGSGQPPEFATFRLARSAGERVLTLRTLGGTLDVSDQVDVAGAFEVIQKCEKFWVTMARFA